MFTEYRETSFFIDEGEIDAIIETLAAEKAPKTRQEQEDFYRERIIVYRMIFSNITTLQLTDDEVLDLWKKILEHKYFLSEKLGRNVGIRVAMLDYIFNIENKMEKPLLVNATEYQRLIGESQRDHKTGIYNSRAFSRMVEKEIERSRRFGFVFSLFLFDLDNFKSFNDTYGHLAGDDLLIHLTKLMDDNLRNIDIIARFGGDEFVVLFPQTDKMAAIQICNRIQTLLSESIDERFHPDMPITLSGGIVMYPFNGLNYQSLLFEADRILYEAKGSGRNLVLTYKEKRTQPRYPCSLDVTFSVRGKEQIYTGKIINVSQHGMLIESSELEELRNLYNHEEVLFKSEKMQPIEGVPVWEEKIDGKILLGCYVEKENPCYHREVLAKRHA